MSHTHGAVDAGPITKALNFGTVPLTFVEAHTETYTVNQVQQGFSVLDTMEETSY